MADIVSAITVRIHLRPGLTMWDALILRIAGPDVRAAFVRALDAAAERIRAGSDMGATPLAAASERPGDPR